jgi:hypothetical protein
MDDLRRTSVFYIDLENPLQYLQGQVFIIKRDKVGDVYFAGLICF